mmetsp:Transcript_21315/g.52820  ORF Transcript_21315/g.52820 Transcript_21315/m.52820 type:complete len:264 (+) Transcript_21315:6768-7559(+)
MFPQTFNQKCLFTRYLETIFFAKCLQLDSRQLLQLVVFRFGFFSPLASFVSFLIRRHGFVRNFFSWHLEDSHVLRALPRFDVLGSTKEERTQLCRTCGIDSQAVGTNFRRNPLSECLDVVLSILSRLEFHRGKVILGIDADAPSLHVRQNLTKLSHVVPVIIVQIRVLGNPGQLLEKIHELLVQSPGPHGIVARIGNELFSKPWIPLQNLNGWNVQNAPGCPVLAETRNPKDFLHGSFSHAQELCREGLQAVTPAILHAACVL